MSEKGFYLSDLCCLVTQDFELHYVMQAKTTADNEHKYTRLRAVQYNDVITMNV